jgi:hypothetical protein
VFEDKLPASDKLRLVLVWAGIPLDELFLTKDNLVGESKPWSKWVTGADVTTDLRNWIVHSTPSNRAKLEQIPSSNRYYASHLSLWHLELVLLKVFGYQGQYSKRIRAGFAPRFQYDVLPWI